MTNLNYHIIINNKISISPEGYHLSPELRCTDKTNIELTIQIYRISKECLFEFNRLKRFILPSHYMVMT